VSDTLSRVVAECVQSHAHRALYEIVKCRCRNWHVAPDRSSCPRLPNRNTLYSTRAAKTVLLRRRSIVPTDIFEFWSRMGRGEYIHPADKNVIERTSPGRGAKKAAAPLSVSLTLGIS
jgi:hypothetical protein